MQKVIKLEKYLIRAEAKLKSLFFNSPKYIKLGIVFLLVAGIYLGYQMFTKSESAEAAWFNDLWLYRKPITITNSSGSTLADYQIKAVSNADFSAEIAAEKMNSDLSDIRFIDSDGNNLSYWIEDGTNNSADIWVKVNSIPTSGATIYMYYGNANTSSMSSVSDTFMADSVYSTNGTCNNSAVCDFADNHNEFDTMMTYSADICSKAVTQLDWGSVCDSTVFNSDVRQHFYSRFRFLFIPDTTGSWSFATDSDDASELVLNTGDQDLSHSVIVSWYAGHGTSNDTSHNGAINLTAGVPVWLEYRFNEWEGGEASRLYAQKPGGIYQIVNTTNFPNTLFARSSYASTEPTAGALGSEEGAPAGPVGYWSFDEGQGTTAYDSSPNGNDGILTNMSSTASSTSGWATEERCVSGKCLKFDGVNDYVNGGDGTSLKITNSITISAWVKSFSNGTARKIVARWGATSNNSYFLGVDSGKIYGGYSSTGSNSFVTDKLTTLPLNEWHFITWTNDGIDQKIYLDGIEKESKNNGGTMSAGTDNLYIGVQSGPLYYFNGSIDEPKIYNYARSADQIKMDYEVGLAGMGGKAAEGASVSVGQKSQKWMSDGLVGHWKMDEASWNGSAGEVIDWSGNNNNGQAIGGVAVGAGKFGNGGNFTSAGHEVDVADSSALRLSQVTLSAWVKTTAPAGNQIIATKRYSVGNDPWNSFILQTVSGKFQFAITNGTPGSVATASSLSDVTSDWTYVVGIYNGSTLKIYVNGILEQSTPTNINIAYANLPLAIGNYGGGWQYNGLLDEVRVYNRALSDKEVLDLYNYAPGPVGWWKFDERTGQTAYDKSGYGNNGTLGAATAAGADDPSWVNGKIGGGLEYDGVDDYVNLYSDIIGTGADTACAWINPLSIGGGTSGVFGRIVDTTKFTFGLNNGNGNRLQFSSNWSTWIYSGANSIDFNQWQYVCVVRDANGITNFYINGVLSGLANQSSGTPDTGTTLMIGGRSSTRTFDGSIDDVRIYNYARTPEQIMADYAGSAKSSANSVGGAVSGSGKTSVAYYKFDEGAGTTAHDSSGNNNGTIYPGIAGNNTATSSMWDKNGKFGGAMEFDGTDDSVSIADNSDLDPKQISVSFWVNSRDLINNKGIIGKRTSSGGNEAWDFFSGVTDNKLRWLVSSNGNNPVTVTNNTTLTPNTWYHIVGTADGKDIRIYVNGELDCTPVSFTSDLYNSTANLLIGNVAPSNYFNGLIDEVKIYNFALTANDVKAEYSGGMALKVGSLSADANGVASSSAASAYCVPGSTDPCAPPVGEWLFNERNGQTAYDTSGNGNNGTLGAANTTGSDDPSWSNGKSGGGLKFDGTDDYVNLGNGDWANITGDITINAWVRATSLSGSGMIIRKGYNSAPFNFYRSGPGLVFYYQSNSVWGGISISNVFTNTEEWINVVATRSYNGSLATLKLYVNGSKMAETTRDGFPDTNSGITSIGYNSSNSSFFAGSIDQVRIYDYARTPAQIAWEYNQGAPIGWWKFDEGQGGLAHDSSGKGNNGTIYPGISGTNTSTSTMWSNGVSGKINGGMDFDGADDYVNIPVNSSSILNISGNQITQAAWIYPTANVVSGTIFTRNGGYYFQRHNDGKLAAYQYGTNGGYRYSTDAVPLNQWTHVAYIYNGSRLIFYINGKPSGVFDKTGNITQVSYLKDEPLMIGWDSTVGNPGRHFSGQLDDVRIYNYALTEQQIKDIYNGGAMRVK